MAQPQVGMGLTATMGRDGFDSYDGPPQIPTLAVGQPSAHHASPMPNLRLAPDGQHAWPAAINEELRL